jgi:hypothetical protein
MWRALRKENYTEGLPVDEKSVTGVLYPDFERKWIESTKSWRRPDVTVVPGEDGLEVKTAGGTSLFDKARVFKGKSWLYFKIPNGTEIPDSLSLTGPKWNETFGANHYQIGPHARMLVESYKGALDNFARNAIVRACDLARGGKEKEHA